MKIVFNQLVMLLQEPNPDDPLDTDIADIYKNKRAQFDKTAKEYVQKYASN
jgi:ubiquitin-conjugating enzyme E2 D/E